MRALRQACRPSGVASGFIADLTRSRAELIAENALLRQQLIVASRAPSNARPFASTSEACSCCVASSTTAGSS